MARLSYIVLIIALNALMCVLAEELYSDLFANIDLPAILQNDNLREEYYKCYMEVAMCKTPEQKAMTGLSIYTIAKLFHFAADFFINIKSI